MRSRSIVKLRRRRPRRFDITNLGNVIYMQCARGDYKPTEEIR